MATKSEQYFVQAKTESGIQQLATMQAEGLYLDFKGDPKQPMKNANGHKAKITKNAGAFANADGGVVIVGVDDKTRQLEPFADAIDAAEVLQRAVTNGLTPAPVVETHVTPSVADPTKGYVVLHIPASLDGPHQDSNKRYYRRHGESADPMEHYEIVEWFGRRARPKLEIQGEVRKKAEEIGFTLYAKNVGMGSAAQPQLLLPDVSQGQVLKPFDAYHGGGHVPWRQVSGIRGGLTLVGLDGFALHPDQSVRFGDWTIPQKTQSPDPPYTVTIRFYCAGEGSASVELLVEDADITAILKGKREFTWS